ncbi:MAG: type II toxin-antitoxin system RelE family toxin [bacterium]
MPKYEVVFTEKAEKDLSHLPDNEVDQILKACLRLEGNPHPDGKHIKKLKGYKDLYRLRIGDYRAVFKWKGNIVTVVRLLTRQDFGKRY